MGVGREAGHAPSDHFFLNFQHSKKGKRGGIGGRSKKHNFLRLFQTMLLAHARDLVPIRCRNYIIFI